MYHQPSRMAINRVDPSARSLSLTLMASSSWGVAWIEEWHGKNAQKTSENPSDNPSIDVKTFMKCILRSWGCSPSISKSQVEGPGLSCPDGSQAVIQHAHRLVHFGLVRLVRLVRPVRLLGKATAFWENQSWKILKILEGLQSSLRNYRDYVHLL